MHRVMLAAVLGLSLAATSQTGRAAGQSTHGKAESQAAAENGDVWWKHAVIYEIYPRSFQDSNGDGIGDLNGITSRLDYLKALGVDAIWLTPIYPSPQVDFGYDISDYVGIDPAYGTMADFDRLVAEAKKRDIRVIMDMVMNHTSDKHPWFIESESSKKNPKRDWYVWENGKGPGQPPNNWQSAFGHSAWQYSPKTDQWYYHKFYIQQPDLNWRNPKVEQAMWGNVRFWLNKGVAGFRLDAVPTLFEDASLKDETILPGTNKYGDPNIDGSLTENLPEVHRVMRDLRDVTNGFPGNRVLIGETYLPNIQELNKWYGANHDELQMPMDMQIGFINKLDVNEFRQRIDEVEHDIGDNQPLLVFDNHDNPRMDARYGDGKHDVDIQRMLATILFATRSTATDVLRRRDRDEDHAAHAGGGREGSGRQDRLAPGQGPRWRTDAHAVGWCARGGIYNERQALVAGAGHLQDSQRGRRGARRRLAAELVQAADPSAPRQSGAALRHTDHAEHDGYEGALLDATDARTAGGGGGVQLYRGAAESQLRPVAAGRHEQAGEDA